MFNMCKLNAGQGNEKVLWEQLVLNNKSMNEDPAWMTDPELIESATQSAKTPGFCDSILQADSCQDCVENQDSMGPKHYSSLSIADKIIVETVATFICKYGTDDMAKFNPVSDEVNRIYSQKRIPQLSMKVIWNDLASYKMEDLCYG